MERREYYLKWLKTAFIGPWGYADSLAGALAIFGSLLVKFNPQWESAFVDLAWMIPLSVFLILTLWRIGIAPFWMHQELEVETLKLKETLQTYGEVKLKITFDSSQSAYVTPEIRINSHARRFRVGIWNHSKKIAENVVVKLIRISPCPEAQGCLPIILKSKDMDSPPFSLKINPADNILFDVAKVSYHQTRRRNLSTEVKVYFEFISTNNKNLFVPVIGGLGHPYELTIEVIDDGGIKDCKNFALGKKGKEYYMEELPEKKEESCLAGNI